MLNLMILGFVALNNIKTNALQCVDQNNSPVDWFVVYKLPALKSSNQLISLGAAYSYMTSKDATVWIDSSISINETNSLIGLNLQALYSNTSNIYNILYNDEAPDGSINFKKGHTKGLVLGDKNGGIWLIHSVPRFPRLDLGKYYFSHNGFTYGQSFLCISLNTDNMDLVGTQLQYNNPNIYSHNIPSSFQSTLPKLTDAVNGKIIITAPWYHLQILKSLANTMFFSFAKGPKFAKELYADWIAPTLNSNLMVETWPNEPNRIPSQCGPIYTINNIKSVSMNSFNSSFKTTVDHSKWAVTASNNNSVKWICIGDINRAVSQRHRGGGSVCFPNNFAANAYQNSILEVESC